jgi:pyruvate/2-oxoglutarate dehydrogenase complex dihydrolipoamide acyltransferase (E2) component
MRLIPIIMPQLGESIAEATVIGELVRAGDEVRADQDLFEVETNKATLSVTAPAPGKVSRLLAQAGQTYPVGAILGYLECDGLATVPVVAGHPHLTLEPEHSRADRDSDVGLEDGAKAEVMPRVRGLPVPAHATGASYMSPRMKARMNELGLHAADLSGVAGSGSAGRVTIDDLERFLEELKAKRLTPASSMRVAVADAMRRSWTRPLATVGLTVCLDRLQAHRQTLAPRPGPALYALRALALALAENSAVAGRLVGNQIVHPSSIDLGFAVEAADGVLVPVLRQADRRSLDVLTPEYGRLVELARARRLPADATGGSAATVTNYGTFGLHWATPIPLPEQTLVLGLGAGRRAPSWDGPRQQFVPVMEAELTLSFDHRVLDGGAAGRLLTRIVELMQQPQGL